MNYLGLSAILILAGINLGVHIAKHGKPREEKYNAWISLVGAIISISLTLWTAGVFG